MKYFLIETHRNLTDKQLLDDMRRAAKHYRRKYISATEYERTGKYYVSTITRRFGSWNRALKLAGLLIKKLAVISDEELLLNLKHVWDSLGRQPKSTEMIRPLSKYRVKVYMDHFGSWRGALRTFARKVNSGKVTAIHPKKTKPRRRKRRQLSLSARFEIMKRDRFRCRLCGASPATDPAVTLHIDHIIPLAKGGCNTIANQQTLCSNCNLGKADKSLSPRRRGTTHCF